MNRLIDQHLVQMGGAIGDHQRSFQTGSAESRPQGCDWSTRNRILAYPHALVIKSSIASLLPLVRKRADHGTELIGSDGYDLQWVEDDFDTTNTEDGIHSRARNR